MNGLPLLMLPTLSSPWALPFPHLRGWGNRGPYEISYWVLWFILLTQCYPHDQIKRNLRARDHLEDYNSMFKSFKWKTTLVVVTNFAGLGDWESVEENWVHGKYRGRFTDTINAKLNEIFHDWLSISHDRFHWEASLNTAMNLHILFVANLSSCMLAFQARLLAHEINNSVFDFCW